MLSVRYLFGCILCTGLLSFIHLTASPEGAWQCAFKSGQVDAFTKYQLNCNGELELNKNGIITSTCSDPFTPSGSFWRTEGAQLLLSDSDNTVFVQYEWEMPDARTLLLKKEGVTFTFDRVFKPQTAKN